MVSENQDQEIMIPGVHIRFKEITVEAADVVSENQDQEITIPGVHIRFKETTVEAEVATEASLLEVSEQKKPCVILRSEYILHSIIKGWQKAKNVNMTIWVLNFLCNS